MATSADWLGMPRVFKGLPKREPIKVLLVEDDALDRALVQRQLETARGRGYALTAVDRWAEANRELRSARFDVVLLDLTLPDARGSALVSMALAEARGTPIVIITGLDDDQVAMQAVQRGAQDYLVKGEMPGETLPRAIRYSIERGRILQRLEEMQRAQLALKDEFVSHVSHELRTPLTAIHQFVGIIHDGLAGPVNDEQLEYLEIVQRNVAQLRGMIEDLMDITRAQTGKLVVAPSPYRIDSSLDDVVEGLRGDAEKKRVAIGLEVADELPRVLADDARVRQIVSNLVSNAIKFTPHGGQVVVRADLNDQDPDYVKITVEDTGCGISPEGLSAIFDRLHQEPNDLEASRKGLGLGLYICRELTKLQGGEIWAESEVGCGSRFYVTLPCFSIERLVRPIIVGPDGRTRDRVSLVTATLTPGDPASTERIENRIVEKAHEALRECALRYMDAVFPLTRDGSVTDHLFLLASADDQGAEALVSRIVTAFERLGLRDKGVETAVHWERLQVPFDEAGAGPPEESGEGMAAFIDVLMQAMRGNGAPDF